MTEAELTKMENEADLKKLEAQASTFCKFTECLNRAASNGLCHIHQPGKPTRERRPA